MITGASRGIGRQLALDFAKAGCNVVVSAKSVTETPGLPGTIYSVADEVEALGVKALPFQLDVQDTDRMADLVATANKELGPVQILINNASALWWKSIEETPVKRYDLINSINSRGTFAMTAACLPTMRESGWGHVITQSPPIDLNEMKGMTAYNISKYGMTMTALGVAQEYKGLGVAGNSIWPVTMIESFATANHQLGSPEHWRKATILSDAILGIASEDPNEFTNNMLLDEPYLRSKGVTDFSKYQCVPGKEPPTIADIKRMGLVKGAGDASTASKKKS